MLTDIRKWIAEGAKRGASDFIWVGGKFPQLKIDDKPFPISDQPHGLSIDEEQAEIKKVVADLLQLTLSKLSLEEFLEQVHKSESGSGEIVWSLGELRLRTSVYLEKGRLAISIRLLPQRILPFEEIFAEQSFIPIIQALLQRQNGLILITGPTGTGKTTSLATFIDYILMNRNGHVITLEDPIEYVFDNKRVDYRGMISQREFGEGRDFTNFARAIIAGLRQAPNIFMVGEIRDPATADAALQAAETGHLVLATLHTRNAAETVTRYVDMFPKEIRDMIRLQFALSTLGIICQKLIPRADGKGRIAAFEILSMTPACANVIRDNRLQQMATYMNREGSIMFDSYLVKLIRRHLVTKDVGFLCANDPKELQQLLTRE